MRILRNMPDARLVDQGFRFTAAATLRGIRKAAASPEPAGATSGSLEILSAIVWFLPSLPARAYPTTDRRNIAPATRPSPGRRGGEDRAGSGTKRRSEHRRIVGPREEPQIRLSGRAPGTDASELRVKLEEDFPDRQPRSSEMAAELVQAHRCGRVAGTEIERGESAR
jgi:hypothetical protein